MNCSHKRLTRKIHNAVLITLYYLNALSLVYWLCWIDAIISWQPYAIMTFNAGFLGLGLYANGWVIGTKPYNERTEREGDQLWTRKVG